MTGRQWTSKEKIKGLTSMKIRKIITLISVIALMLAVLGCNAETNQTGQSEDSGEQVEADTNEAVKGGELRVGIAAQPPSLDPHLSTVISTRDVTRQIFESLVTVNSKYEVVPQLAESVEQSEDGKTYTFPLRKGVLFHNGKEMTAEDVVASMNRWKETASSIPTPLKEGTFEAKDEHTVVLQVTEPSALILPILAKTLQFAAIMPKEVVEAADEKGINEFVGTGPFKFAEWKQDQYIHLTQYEDYQPLEETADGLAGKKEALVDDVYFDVVPDAATQVAGIQTEQYDIVTDLPNEYYEQVTNTPNLNVEVSSYGHQALLFDKNDGWFTDIKMRQAVNAALDMDAILKAAFINEDLYRVSSSNVSEDKTLWYSEAGKENYNQHDLEKAKRLLKEAGYNGEKITLLSTRDYAHIYNSSVVVKEQLAEVGMNVELEVYDYATVMERRADPKNWELFITGFADGATPIDKEYYDPEYFDGPMDDKATELIHAFETSATQEEAQNVWNELQGYLWESLPIIKFGDFMKLSAYTDKVQGYTFLDGPVLWNTTVSQ